MKHNLFIKVAQILILGQNYDYRCLSHLSIIITIMRFLLFISCLLVLLQADPCQTLYWEIDPNYQIPLDQTQIVASHQLVLADVKTSHGIYPSSKQYIIYDIKGKGKYDDSKVQTKISNDSVTVTGAVINLDFKLYTMTKPSVGKGYDGNATATLANITVNYTKKPTLLKGAAVWTLSNLSPSIPNNLIPNNDYTPPFYNAADKPHFDDLITTDLYAQVSAYYNMNLSSLFAQAMQSQAMSKTFNSSSYYAYKYPGTNTSININVSVANFSISNTDGVAIGYYAQVKDTTTRCTDFTPDLTIKASSITQELIYAVWEGFTHTSVWQPSTQDSTTLKSKYFKFKMIDLDSVAPSITSNFSNYLEPLVAKCNLKTTIPTITFDQTYQRLGTTLDWSCGLFRTGGAMENLLGVNLSISYKVNLSQQGSKVRVRIGSAELVSSVWLKTSYEMVNIELANIYLSELVSSLSGVETLGDGFPQPFRKSPKVSIMQNYIRITDEASVLVDQ